jgi:rhodanese-related sulfurtransferase
MADERQLSPRRAAELAENEDAQLVDVRTREEHEAGHIRGARHVPLERLTDEAGELDSERPVLLYCRGGERSAMAAAAFAASGWEAWSIEGGLAAWAAEGLPLEPQDGRVAERSLLPSH